MNRRTAYTMLALMTMAQIGGAVVQQGLGSLGPVFVAAFSLSNAQLGVIFGALAVGSASATIAAGLIVDRFGERPVIFWGGLLLGGALVLAALVPSYWWLVFWTFVFGATYAAQTPAGGRAILAWFDKDRGFAMSIRQAGVPLGGAIGSTLLPIIALHWSYGWALIAGGIVGAGTAAIAAAFYVDAPRAASAPVRMRDLAGRMLVVARKPLTVLFTGTCMVLSAGQSIFNAFFVVTAVTLVHVSPIIGATVFAGSQVCAVGGRIMWGRLSDGLFRGNRAWPLVCIATLLALASFALPHAGAGGIVVLAVVGAALGLSAAGWNGVFATAMAEIGGAELAGSILGLGLTFIFGAQALGPALFGELADRAGLAAAWTVFGVIAALGILAPLAAARLSGRPDSAG